MKIGILGAGNVGGALGRAWQRRSHDIMFGVRNGRSGEKTARFGAMEEAAGFAEIVVIALPWQAAYELVPLLDLQDKTVVDCTNPPPRAAAVLQGSFASGAEALQARAPRARMVKAFNTTGANNMDNPIYDEGRLAMFYCGDHDEAKRSVESLIRDVGFDPWDLGPLSNAGLMEAQARLWISLASRGDLGREFGFRLIRR